MTVSAVNPDFCETTKPAEAISFAHLFSVFPMEAVKQALCEADANDERERDLPAKYMVYFVIGLSMYSASSLTVFRHMVETLKEALGPLFRIKVPAKSSITYKRQKLTSKVFEILFKKIVRPIAQRELTKGAFFKQWRLVSIDGATFNLKDTSENEEEFGRGKPSGSPASYPSTRVVGFVESGTRVLFDYEMGPAGGPNQESEIALATELLPRLKPDYLCLADRLYANHNLWKIALSTGAALLWRVKSSIELECLEVLPDGSFLSKLGSRADALDVRVIEYNAKGEEIRLITNIPYKDATNDELVPLYHERWQQEIAYKEQKDGLNKYLDTLRSKTPDLVKQEIIALMLMYFAVRVIMHDAALSVGRDVDTLSFTHTIDVIRRRAPQVGRFSPSSRVPSDTKRSIGSKSRKTNRQILA